MLAYPMTDEMRLCILDTLYTRTEADEFGLHWLEPRRCGSLSYSCVGVNKLEDIAISVYAKFVSQWYDDRDDGYVDFFREFIPDDPDAPWWDTNEKLARVIGGSVEDAAIIRANALCEVSDDDPEFKEAVSRCRALDSARSIATNIIGLGIADAEDFIVENSDMSIIANDGNYAVLRRQCW